MKTYRNNRITNGIDVDIAPGVSIGLHGHEYVKFMEKLIPDMNEQFEDARKTEERIDLKRKQLHDLTIRLREVFYEEFGDWSYLRRSKDDINWDELDSILEDNSKLLGFTD